MPRSPRIRFLGTPSTPTPETSEYYHVPKILVREPRLMVPGMQPIGPVKVDTSNSLAPNHAWLMSPSNIGLDLRTGKKAQDVSNVTHGTANNGWRVRRTATAYNVNEGKINISNIVTNSSRMSCLLIMQNVSTANQGGPKLGTNDLNSHMPYDGTVYLDLLSSSRWVVGVPPTGKSLTTRFVMSASVESGNSKAYWDGALWVTDTSAVTVGVDSSKADFLISDVYAQTWGYLGWLEFAAIWNRYLSPAEHFDLAMNPYQFLIPA